MSTNKKDILALMLICCSLFLGCKSNQAVESDDFPMYRFKSYLPYQKGDTIYYDRYYIKSGKDTIKLDSNVPFVVLDIIDLYEEGDIQSYNKEYAEYSVVLQAKNEQFDSILVLITFVCTGRTRIGVKYTSEILYNHEYPTSITGQYNLASRSDSLFIKFPMDVIELENKDYTRQNNGTIGLIKQQGGLIYFYDMMTFLWKLNR